MSCCPTTYWCTAAGPVGVEADGDGEYTPPLGATGGPYATEAEAWARCGPGFPCSACTPDDESVPPGVWLHFANRTGDAVNLPYSVYLGYADQLMYPWSDLTPPPNSLVSCSGVNGQGPGYFGYSTEYPLFGVVILGALVQGLNVAWGGPGVSGQWWVRVAMNAGYFLNEYGVILKTPSPNPYYYGTGGTPYPGWNQPAGGQGLIVSKLVPCNICVDEVVFEGLETGDTGTGTYDLVVSR